MLDAAQILPERPRPLRRVEYDRLVASGAFDDERIELLHGVLVDMSPNRPEHANPVERLTMSLAPALVGRALVRVQLPLIAGDESEPEPDVAVVPPGDYRHEHPARALLVVEVAVSSLSKDRNVKAPLYAASGFEEYWIVDVAGHAVEVYRGAGAAGYASVQILRPGDVARPAAFPDVEVEVDGLFR